ncbi:hypothetical protein DENIS_3034 [Desulfonema ishimotonii]|uniref:Lcl C-terminal domain-containing protein n=1 Tax=Desulfonema ishimotonii TaxID=45657 RepID=A0A401FYM7_9BACT|nr:DUF1566 domain-containing protein [Desulfonema ishimotonii]GBC62071.1 hypothetical protein DENIS_3034 [Desulfonema ishimotonii]
MLDAGFVLNRCVDYQSAVQYADTLTTGGHTDWRLPRLSELESILRKPPLFPSARSRWLWSSEMYWHGWNKKVHGFMAVGPATWKKDAIGAEQCGSVLAVRP